MFGYMQLQQAVPTTPHIFTVSGLLSFNSNYLPTFQTFSLINLTGFFNLMVLCFLFIYFSYFVSNKLFISSLFSFTEKELNNLEDFFYSVSLIILFFLFNFFGLFCFFGELTFSATSFVFCCLTVLLILIPLTLLFHFGFYFIISLRGAASGLSVIYELLLDYINVLSFFLRLNIQLVRIVIIGVVYLMYNELLYTYSYFFTPTLTISSQQSLAVGSLITFYVRLLFEIIHVFIIFGAQFGAFFVMVIWLFQYLFTLFFDESFENHLSFKRATS